MKTIVKALSLHFRNSCCESRSFLFHSNDLAQTNFPPHNNGLAAVILWDQCLPGETKWAEQGKDMEQASSPWMTGLPKRASPSWSQPSLAFLLTDAPASRHVSPDMLFKKSCKVALWPHFSEDLQGSQLLR